MSEKYYKISEEQLLDLLASSAKLIALENGGVDNWAWCGDSISDFLNQVIEENQLDPDDDFWFEDVAKLDIKYYEEIE